MQILQIDKNHPLIKTQLEEKGFVVDEDITSGYEQILQKIKDYDGLIIRSRIPLDENFLNNSNHLKFIARVGAGMENIDVATAKKHNILLINSPEGNRDAVAEHVVGSLLVLRNRLFISSMEVKNGVWKREENRGTELKGKVFGIIGYGNMGKATAQRLSGFGMEVLFHDILPNLSDDYAKQVSLNELQERAEVISLHVPLTSLTHHLINADFISKMKHDFYLVNTARGKNVSTPALIDALKSGKIKGAALDVLEYESSSFEHLETQDEAMMYLLNSDKVLITPHIAGWTHESKIKLAQVIVNKIIAAFS